MKQEIKKALDQMGIESLHDFQTEAIQVIEQGRNVRMLAPTGSGKTFAYLIPLLDMTEAKSPYTEGLVITPERELTLQIKTEAEKLAVFSGHHITALIGGIERRKQENSLKNRPTVLCATPGRLLDLYMQKKISFDHLKILVFDEADQIYATGQMEDVRKLLDMIPDVQRIFVSATWDEKLDSLLPENYVCLDSGTVNRINDQIDAYYVICMDKRKELLNILKHADIRQAIVFTKFKKDAIAIAEDLNRHEILAAPFSSYLDERKRIQTLNAFRHGTIRVLVATNAASRGLDLPSVSHIIHYDLPDNDTDFIHRSGRTARQNHHGTTIVFIRPEEEKDAEYIINKCRPYSTPDGASDLSRPVEITEGKVPDAFVLWIGAGRKDKIRPKDIIGALCAIYSFDDLGALDIQDTYSTIVIRNKKQDISFLFIKGKKRRCRIQS